MYSVPIAYLLWFFSGFGALGLHRFYLGKPLSGLLYLFTGGLGMVGGIYDFFTLSSQVREANIRDHYQKVIFVDDDVEIVRRPRLVAESRRKNHKESLERVILKLAKKSKGIVTPSEVALEGDVSLDEAKTLLEKHVNKGFAEMRVTKEGNIVYLFTDFYSHEQDLELEDF